MTRACVCLIAIILSVLTGSSAAAEKYYDISEVKVISTGSGYMYSYLDETGQLVVRDVPPPGYLESLTAQRAKEQVVDEPEIEPRVVLPPLIKEPVKWQQPTLSLLAMLLVIAATYVFLAPLFHRWRNESPLQRVLRRAAFPVFIDIELSRKDLPSTKIDCLACTPSGVLVLGNPHFAGTISGQPDHDFWMQKARSEAIQIGNPLRKNARDTRIVESLLAGVPVHGRVVYTGRADVPALLQTNMERLPAFAQTLDLFANESPDQRSLAGGWRTLMRYPRANSTTVRVMGAGWKRRIFEHRRVLLSGSLIVVAMIVLILKWSLSV